MPANKEVAQWLLDQITSRGRMYHWQAVREMEKEFGEEFTADSETGVRIIRHAVMLAFSKLSKGKVQYSQRARRWDAL